MSLLECPRRWLRRSVGAVAFLFGTYGLVSCQNQRLESDSRVAAEHSTASGSGGPSHERRALPPPTAVEAPPPFLSPQGTLPGSHRLRAESVRALKRAHLQADRAGNPAQRAAAALSLRAAAAAMPSAPGVEATAKQDAWYRLGELLIQDGLHDEALKAVQQGLAVSQEPSVPLAGLLELHGRLLERSGRKTQAVEAYHHALQVSELLMRQSLDEESISEEQSP